MREVKTKKFRVTLGNGEEVEVSVHKNSVLLKSCCSNDGEVSFCPSLRSAGVSTVNHAQALVNSMTEVVNDVGQFAKF